MGRDIAFAVEARTAAGFVPQSVDVAALGPFFHRLELLGKLPTAIPVYSIARRSEFSAVLQMATPQPNRMLPLDASSGVRTAHGETSDSGYGQPGWLPLAALNSFDWDGEHQLDEDDPRARLAADILAAFAALRSTLARLGPPADVRLVYWFF